MKKISLVACFLIVVGIVIPESFCAGEDCIKGSSYLYDGTRSTTSSGATCQRWDTNVPHEVKKLPQDGGRHNHCRNPDKDVRGTWCYTTDPGLKWEYCEIPKCDDSTVVVWTSFDEEDGGSFFDHVKADPELVSQEGVSSGTMTKKVFQNAEIKAIAAGKTGEAIFFTDIRNNYFGVFNTKSFEVQKLFEGPVGDIYAISQDWMTGNFYWTDTKMKWVLAADREFRAQVPIHNSDPAEPRAITVHHSLRKLIFSTYVKLNTRVRDTQIIIADLAGNNQRILWKLPDVTDVTGIAVSDERIYWTDNVGYACKVMSSFVDGNDKKEHHMKRTSFFRDIAVHSDYVYITDSQTRYNYFDHIRYSVDVIRKDTAEVYTYSKPGKPHGIAILRKADDNDLPTPLNGVRKCLKSCGGVCLPGTSGVHRCFCSFGYHLHQSTGSCLPKIVKDEYLLALDKDSGRSYQIPLTSSTPWTAYSIVPFGKVDRIGSVTTDLSTGNAYLFDTKTYEMKRGKLNSDVEIFYSPVYAKIKHMIVDPLSNHIYYIDENSDIRVISGDGNVHRTVVENDDSSDVKMLALDMKKKMMYWTDTHLMDGSGELKRSKLNGKGVETVLENLQSPYGLSVDPESRKLFVMDAKPAVLYELLLDKMGKIKQTSVSNYKAHNLYDLVSTRKFTFTEIVAHGGFIYIADESIQHLLRYELGASGSEALTDFGPSIFYRPSSLSVYSSDLYKKKIATLPDPCKKMKCKKMCLAFSVNKAKCINK